MERDADTAQWYGWHWLCTGRAVLCYIAMQKHNEFSRVKTPRSCDPLLDPLCGGKSTCKLWHGHYPAQLNTKEQKKEITKNVSNPIRTADEREQYRDLIRENIEYDILAKNNPADRIRLDELVELMLDTVCSKRSSIRIAEDEFPAEVVKSRFLKLEAQHIQYVLDSLKDNPPHIRNIKKYLLAALYNAPLTIENYYAAQINHDLYGRNRGDVNWK